MAEGLVGSEDIDLCWLQHGFFVWCGQPPRSREWEMLSSTSVITENGIVLPSMQFWDVLVMQHSFTGFFSRLTPDVRTPVADRSRMKYRPDAVLQQLICLAAAASATKSGVTMGGVIIRLRRLQWDSNKFLDLASLPYLQEMAKQMTRWGS